MAAARLGWCVAFTWMACTASEAPAPIESPPPPLSEPVTPPGPALEPPELPLEVPMDPLARLLAGGKTVAIASVQLIQDCPGSRQQPSERVEMNQRAPTPKERAAAKKGAGRRPQDGRGRALRQPCTQSTVQLAVAGDSADAPPRRFKVEAVRLLDAASQKVAGTAKLREPTRWEAGMYRPWDERVAAQAVENVSYKLGEPDVSKAAETVGPGFDAREGPFILELEVSVDGARQTLRSSEFSREPPHRIVT